MAEPAATAATGTAPTGAAPEVARYFPMQPVSAPLGIPAPDWQRGYADSPLVASWKAKSAAGTPVTLDERNAFIASLAWCADQLAVPPTRGSIAPRFVLGADGALVVALGSREFEGGDDIAVPTSGGSSGGVIDYTVYSTAERRRLWKMIQATIAQFKYVDSEIGVVATTAPGGCPAGDPTYAPSCSSLTAPSGAISMVAAGTWVVVIGIAAYAAYRAYTTGVRIREDANKANVAAQIHAQAESRARDIQYTRDTGRAPPPHTEQPIVLPPPAQNTADSWVDKLTSTATTLAWVGLVSAVAVGLAPIVWEKIVAAARDSVKREESAGA